jgi:UDP-N-acetylmuramate-alanine ligase
MLYYNADTTLITTLSHDHVDIYPTKEDYFQAFRQFTLKTENKVYGIKTDAGFQSLVSLIPNTHISKIATLQTQLFEFDYIL